MTIRILTFDGSSSSGGTGFVSAAMLVALRQHLDKTGDRRALLGEVELFAGTSLGAVNALALASAASPDDAVLELLPLWAELIAALQESFTLTRGAAALAGRSAYLSMAPIRAVLERRFGATTRLRDLARPVLVPSFMLDGELETRARWRPRVFCSDDPRDADERVVDVILRSAAAPLLYPIVQGADERGSGYVDGGLVANNPAMLAITQMLEGGATLDQLAVLSLGNAWVQSVVRPSFKHGEANWGFATWLLDPKDPMLLMSMALEAGGAAIDRSVRALLEQQYLRIDPFAADSLSVKDAQQLRAVVDDLLAQRATTEALAEATQWLTTSGWLAQAESEAP